MVYKEKLVAAIKCNNKVLRESSDNVQIPFGSEYTIYLKNLHDRDVVVNIDIDGQDATLNGLLLKAGQEIDLERFVGDDLDSGNKFKFIERSSDIEQHRGIGTEDGLIRIVYQFQRKFSLPPQIQWPTVQQTGPYYVERKYYGGPTYGSVTPTLPSDIFCSAAGSSDTEQYDVYSADVAGSSAKATAKAVTRSFTSQTTIHNPVPDSIVYDAGITVKGSESDQSFTSATAPLLEAEEHVIVFKLLGEVGQAKVKAPVTVKTKKQCPSCGRKYSRGQKFCQSDGTFLDVV